MYRVLSPALIERTVEELHAGLLQYFPESGLVKVVAEILDVARELEGRAQWIRPGLSLALRGSVALVGMGIITLLVWAGPLVASLNGVRSLAEFMEAAESGLQLLLLLGAAIFFIVSLEHRIVSRNVLMAISELRSLVHVVDMHQLRKGPEHLRARAARGVICTTPAVEATELIRYLDFCSEILAMLSKMSAFYVQRVQDPAVVGSVQEVQVLAIGLSQKIWQKIAILDRMVDSSEKRGDLEPGADADYGPGVSSP